MNSALSLRYFGTQDGRNAERGTASAAAETEEEDNEDQTGDRHVHPIFLDGECEE